MDVLRPRESRGHHDPPLPTASTKQPVANSSHFYLRFSPPKSLVNCNVRMGGTGTGIQVINAICVLSVNVYNEIVFVVLWFWLFFLALATAAHILYLALLTAFPTVGIAVKSLGMDEESKVGRSRLGTQFKGYSLAQ